MFKHHNHDAVQLTRVTYMSLVTFRPVEFSGGRLEVKSLVEPLQYPAVATSRTKRQTGQKVTNDPHTELHEPAASQQHGHDRTYFNAPTGVIQYICNHSHFAETQLLASGSRKSCGLRHLHLLEHLQAKT